MVFPHCTPAAFVPGPWQIEPTILKKSYVVSEQMFGGFGFRVYLRALHAAHHCIINRGVLVPQPELGPHYSHMPITLRAQVLNNHILAQNLYYNYYYPNPKYLIIGYLDP